MILKTYSILDRTMFFSCSHLSTATTHADGLPPYLRNSRAILTFYNTILLDSKANFKMVTIDDDLSSTMTDRQKRDSLLKRRIIGAAIIICLVLLGLALPVVI